MFPYGSVCSPKLITLSRVRTYRPYEVYVDHHDINVKKHIADLIGKYKDIRWTARKRADMKLPIVQFSDLISCKSLNHVYLF